MEQDKEIHRFNGEETRAAAYSKNSNGTSIKPPPYTENGPDKQNGSKGGSVTFPKVPYPEYHSKNAKRETNKGVGNGLFMTSFNSNYLDRKNPKNERAEQEEKLRRQMVNAFENTNNSHLSELNQTNNMIGADGVTNQYNSIVNPIGKSIAGAKTPYDGSADRNQAVRASTAAYGGEYKKYSPTEWEPSDLLEGKINEEHLQITGFKFQLFEKVEVNEKNVKEKRYMLAFAGTEDLKDWTTNYLETKGSSQQYEDAAKLARVVANLVGGADKVIFVGHSLGGGLASTAAYATGSNAITFNAAAVSEPTKENLKDKYKNIDLNERASNINAYVYAGEILDLANRVRGSKADGNFKYVHKKNESGRPGDVLEESLKRHGIENFFDIFNIDQQEVIFENYSKQHGQIDIPEDFDYDYENQPPTHIEPVKDYRGGLGANSNK